MSLARLRSVGVLPWLAFVAWMAIAGSQEPVMLRAYGIHLLDQASWAGGLVLLGVLLLVESRQPARLGWLANLAVLCLVATAQMLPPAILDLVYGRQLPGDWLLSMPAFLVCWAPVALCHSALAHRRRSHCLPLLAVAFVLGSVHSVAIRSPDPFHGLLSAMVAIVAATVWGLNARK